jgi:osmotically-inducible protein OsmY
MNKLALHAGPARALLAALAITGVLGGCVAVAGGAMVGGTMVAVDRRSTGTQLDDQAIDLRASGAITAALGDRGHVNANSYNRVVLLTGEVPSDADRTKVEAAVAKVENVRAVVNEVAVMPNSSFGQQTNDTVTTGKVKAAFVDNTERGVVYLMGRVSEAEAAQAANSARSVGGVQKVVKVFEILTPAELAAVKLDTGTTPAAASAPRK